ncbi:hypothetical protein P280DRAFT_467387 [Massarina eburnea CBS 473.64]|uniref:Uncharacterized protein n=1 Tax=Massarina eburnea CBS 473.64 TaxID=1395130 RepID=A0A6A6SAZ0_9PLEO|nr:hypothetical protein P280DRAFT_467387 [Massarina eburnea CBS 473.64]
MATSDGSTIITVSDYRSLLSVVIRERHPIQRASMHMHMFPCLHNPNTQVKARNSSPVLPSYIHPA